MSNIGYRWIFVDICFARWVKEDKSLMADLAHYSYIMRHKIVFSLYLVGALGMPNSVATCISHVGPFICWCMQLHVHVGLKATPCLVIHMQLEFSIPYGSCFK